MTQIQHTTSIVTDEPVSIVVGSQAPGLWHKVLDALWDNGIIGELPDSAYRVLGVFLRHRRTEDGIVTISIPAIARMCRRSRSYVYDGRAILLASPHGLLAERADVGRDTYQVLPGWNFAGRSVRNGGQFSATADDPVHAGGRFSATADKRSVPHKETRARIQNKNQDIDDDDVAVKLLTENKTAERFGGAFSLSDARGLLRSSGANAETVRVAVRNSDAKAAAGDLRSWRGYVAKQLQHGCTLFAGLAREDDERMRNRDTVRRLVEAAEAFGAVEDAQAVRAWWAALGAKGQLGVFDAGDRSRYSDDRLWEILRTKARVGVQA